MVVIFLPSLRAETGITQERVACPVYVHRAGSAQRDTATVFASGQSQLIAQNPEQRHLRLTSTLTALPFTLNFAIGRSPDT